LAKLKKAGRTVMAQIRHTCGYLPKRMGNSVSATCFPRIDRYTLLGKQAIPVVGENHKSHQRERQRAALHPAFDRLLFLKGGMGRQLRRFEEARRADWRSVIRRL
jgi:hypothetical protein